MARTISRRELLKVLGAGAATGILAACQPQVVERTVEVQVEVPVEQTVVVKETVEVEVEGEAPPVEMPLLRFAMYNFDPWLSALPKMFNDFETEVGTAQVKLEAAPWDQFWARFESQAAAGIAPDLQIGDPSSMARYIDKGVYLNVDPYIDADALNLDDWLAATIEACRYNTDTGIVGAGSQWGMPATLVGTILYFNKTLFDGAGVSYPTADWDRTDYEAAATALTQDRAGNSPDDAGFNADDIAVYGSSTVGGYSTAVHLWNNGGGLISEDVKECWIDKPESVEIFQWLADLMLEKKINPPGAWFTGQPDVFLTERIAMKLDGSWNLDYYVENLTFDWDVMDVPKGTAGLDRISYAGTNTMHIYSGTQYPDQSWDLLKYISGPGGMKYFLKTGTPALKSAAQSDDYMTGSPDHRQIAIDVGDYGRTYYPHRSSDKWKEVYNQEIEALYLGQGTAEEVCAAICDKIQPILDEAMA